MLTITIKGREMFDDDKQEFIVTPDQTLVVEHSLLSLSKWESKHHKPFLGKEAQTDMTYDEMVDYIRCMTINKPDPMIYFLLTNENYNQIKDYISDPMTATTIKEPNGRRGTPRVITSELIYYWMASFNLPFEECEKWHLNRLLTLIRVCDAEEAPKQKMSAHDILNSNRSLNQMRRAKLGTRG